MRLDHVSFAAGPDGLASTAQRIGGLLGTEFVDGGVHPRFGTRNVTLPLAGNTYMEIVEVLDHPASDKAPFGQAVRARSALGGGWLGWVVSVDDIAPIESRLGREAVKGNRHRPDGTELLWQQIGVNGLLSDPQLPFFIQWESPAELHPSNGASGDYSLACLEIAGDPQRVSEWLGETVEAPLEDVKVEWVAPNGTPGIVAVQIQTPNGLVRSERARRAGLDAWARPMSKSPTSRGRDGRVEIEPGPPRTSGTPPSSTSSRTAPPTRTGASRPRCARSRLGRAHACSTSAAAPASTSPCGRSPRRAWSASSRTRRWSRSRGVVRVGWPTSPCSRAAAEALPLPDASVDVVHARWAYFFGPGSEPGPARARPGRTPRGHRVRDRQRPHPVDLRRLVPPRLPRGRPGRGRAVLVDARVAAPPDRHGLVVRLPRGPRVRRAHRAAARRSPRRRSPRTPAPRSTTPSTSGGAH